MRPQARHLTIAGFTSSSGINDTVNFGGAGEIDVLGEIQHTTSARYLVLNFNQAGTVALRGSDSLKANNVNGAYHPSVNLNSGTTVLNNSNALYAPTVPFVTLGATSGGSPATLLLGGTDSAGLTGGISTNDNGATIDVEDLTTGLLTIGGQNTSGVNTVSNNIQLGVSSNTGKSVTLVAAPGGEVLFSGELLSNGTNTTAGVTVGNASNTGIVKLSGANTYGGGTTVNGGTLLLGNVSGLGLGGLTANNGTVDLASFSPTVTSLSGSAGTITNSVAPATLHVNQSGLTTFSGALQDGNGGALRSPSAAPAS